MYGKDADCTTVCASENWEQSKLQSIEDLNSVVFI